MALLDNNHANLNKLAVEFIEKINDISDAPLLNTSKDLDCSVKEVFWCSVLGISLIFLSFFICI